MSSYPLEPALSFDALGLSQRRVLFRGNAEVYFALGPSVFSEAGFNSEVVITAIPNAGIKDGAKRKRAKSLDVTVSGVLLQTGKTEREIIHLIGEKCRVKIRFDLSESEFSPEFKGEEIRFENEFINFSDNLTPGFDSKIRFEITRRMSVRQYQALFMYDDGTPGPAISADISSIDLGNVNIGQQSSQFVINVTYSGLTSPTINSNVSSIDIGNVNVGEQSSQFTINLTYANL